MLLVNDLLNSLNVLDALYLDATTSLDKNFFCKLAVLELGGWTEQAMDLVISECSMRQLIEQNNKDYCSSQIINRTYGFEYNSHFRGMMMRLVGLIHLERIESVADGATIAGLRSALSTLKTWRDPAAHTYISGTTPQMTAPSVVISKVAPIVAGLTEIEHQLLAAGF